MTAGITKSSARRGRPSIERPEDDAALKAKRQRNREAQHIFRQRRQAAAQAQNSRLRRLEEVVEELSTIFTGFVDEVLQCDDVVTRNPKLVISLQKGMERVLRLAKEVGGGDGVDTEAICSGEMDLDEDRKPSSQESNGKSSPIKANGGKAGSDTSTSDSDPSHTSSHSPEEILVDDGLQGDPSFISTDFIEPSSFHADWTSHSGLALLPKSNDPYMNMYSGFDPLSQFSFAQVQAQMAHPTSMNPNQPFMPDHQQQPTQSQPLHPHLHNPSEHQHASVHDQSHVQQQDPHPNQQAIPPLVSQIYGNGWIPDLPYTFTTTSPISNYLQDNKQDSFVWRLLQAATARNYHILTSAGAKYVDPFTTILSSKEHPIRDLNGESTRVLRTFASLSREQCLYKMRWFLGPGKSYMHVTAHIPRHFLNVASTNATNTCTPSDKSEFLSVEDIHRELSNLNAKMTDSETIEITIKKPCAPKPAQTPVGGFGTWCFADILASAASSQKPSYSSFTTGSDQQNWSPPADGAIKMRLSVTLLISSLIQAGICLVRGPAFQRGDFERAVAGAVVGVTGG